MDKFEGFAFIKRTNSETTLSNIIDSLDITKNVWNFINNENFICDEQFMGFADTYLIKEHI